MKLAATIVGSLKADLQAEMRRIEQAVAAGVKEAGEGLKGELRRQVIAAGLGQRLARTWRSRSYPNRGHDAAALVWSEAPQIVRAFDEGAVIRSRKGFWLTIPTPAFKENVPSITPRWRRATSKGAIVSSIGAADGRTMTGKRDATLVAALREVERTAVRLKKGCVPFSKETRSGALHR